VYRRNLLILFLFMSSVYPFTHSHLLFSFLTMKSLIFFIFFSSLSIIIERIEAQPRNGLAWPTNNIDSISLFTQPNSQIEWIYNWSPYEPEGGTFGLEFVPMQWGSGGIENLKSIISSQQNSILLGFNEPDQTGQSNLTPSEAAQLWQEYIQPLKAAGIVLGAPAVSNGPNGLPWLQQFFQECQGCTFDFIPLHWYGVGLGPFYNYIWGAYYEFRNVTEHFWITEFAETNWDSSNPLPDNEVFDFLNATQAYLPTILWVDRVAWFGAMRDTGTVGPGAEMINSNGDLTQIGLIYTYGDSN